MGTFRQISQPLCTILLPTQTTLAFHIPGCPRNLQTSLQVAFPTTKIQSLLFQAASFCQTVFSEQRSHVKPKCLRCMSRATLSQHQNLQQHNNLRWGEVKARRNESGRLICISSGFFLCSDWQRPVGCSATNHPQRHLCSRCEEPNHGAQNCPRAQKL